MEQQQQEDVYKIVLVGEIGAGKSSICDRYVKNQFNSNRRTIPAMQFASKHVKINDKTVKLSIHDVWGNWKYKSLSKVYCPDVSGILFVYDVTDVQSYQNLQKWISHIAQTFISLNITDDDVVSIIVGNKIDKQQQRKISKEKMLKQFKQQYDIDCQEVSAKTGYNIENMFNKLIAKIFQKTQKKKQQEKLIRQEQMRKRKRKEKQKRQRQVPQYLLCPISQDIMTEPILITVCGHTFQGSIIRQWARKKLSCPLCNTIIPDPQKCLLKNFALADALSHFNK